MEDIIFQGEHLLPGNTGHFAVVLAFATSIFASIAFALASRKTESPEWGKAGTFAFGLHSVSVLTIFITLFYIIHSHYFEYQYAWQHSSLDLPWYYMISCFWEGQEGSFLLWMFWHTVLGCILIFTAKNWRSPVLLVISLCQVALSSMLIGIKIFDYKLGSSPFELVRNVMVNAPIFSNPDYMGYDQMKDGNGLNPLLQNYWMVIHPPTLFFGFAATIVPFAYVIAALIRKQYTEWIKPALPWALLAVMVLGTGIVMGGFWAYESLSFGGYWAWDPVENASLIPWLILIGGVHLMLVNKSTQRHYFSSMFLIITTFLLVLYATFLTRSGILGNSSVHSFTDLGMSGQLLVFLFAFCILPLLLVIDNVKYILFYLAGVLLLVITAMFDWGSMGVAKPYVFIATGLVSFVFFVIKLYKAVPRQKDEESPYSREFWMFIGSLIFIISAFQIIVTTSIPVFNKVLGTNMAPPTDVIAHYNKWQLPIAIIIALLTGIGQLLKFKKSDPAKFGKKLAIISAIALALAGISFWWFSLNHWLYFILLFAAVFTITVNLHVAWPFINGKIKIAGSSVAHIGFGLMLVGVLVSSANKNVISRNETGQALFSGDDEKTQRENFENIYLERGKPVQMKDYRVTYIGDSAHWVNTHYKVRYEKLDGAGNVTGEFMLYPNGQINKKMGFIANPDTRHYLSHDVFTYVSSVPNRDAERVYENEKTHEIKQGDTIQTNNGTIYFEGLESNVAGQQQKPNLKNLDLVVSAVLRVQTLDSTYIVKPVYGIQNNGVVSFEETLDAAGLRFRFIDINPKKETITIETAESKPLKSFIIMKAIVFPYINFLWGGTIIMIIGFLMTIVRRISELRR